MKHGRQRWALTVRVRVEGRVLRRGNLDQHFTRVLDPAMTSEPPGRLGGEEGADEDGNGPNPLRRRAGRRESVPQLRTAQNRAQFYLDAVRNLVSVVISPREQPSKHSTRDELACDREGRQRGATGA